MTNIAIHIFDTAVATASTNGNVHTHACSVTESASVLTELIATDSNGVCCVASAGLVPDADQLIAATDKLKSASAAIGILPGAAYADLPFIWKRLPSALASFVMSPESRGVILLDTSQLLPTPSSNGDQPIQELVIRTALQNQESVVLLGSDEIINESPLPNANIALPELAPRRPGSNRRWIADLLRQVNPQKYLKGEGESCEAEALIAGLFQINDYLDESHNRSQSIEGEGQDVNGDYWHGIMHRREPDYGNGKYWFRRVGHHPCFDLLPAVAEQAFDECASSKAEHWKSRLTGSGNWNGAAFIDLCEAAERSSDSELTTAARRIQWAEMLLLLDHTYRQASGL
ncbi:MAG: hypothetical protein HQ518_17025 [Rhodopirellula sp.]|nr:hypothetical protein [Rhodopirellula sp.]